MTTLPAPVDEPIELDGPDELRHLDFHADTLPEHLRRFGPVAGPVVRLAWNVLVVTASVLVAVDNGRALGSVGVGRRRFVADLWRLRRDLDRRLFGAVAVPLFARRRPPGPSPWPSANG